MTDQVIRVLRWEVPVDDEPHAIGAGKVLRVEVRTRADLVEVWTEERVPVHAHIPQVAQRTVQVYGTGHGIPPAYWWLGTCLAGPLVWHLYEVREATAART